MKENSTSKPDCAALFWKKISSRQKEKIPADLFKAIDDVLSVRLGEEELSQFIVDLEKTYREPVIEPDVHCAATGSLLCIIRASNSLLGHYGWALTQVMNGKNEQPEYFSRYLILNLILQISSGILTLLSSRNEAAMRVLLRSLLEACEYLLVIPRNDALAKSYALDRDSFSLNWSKSLRPAKIRAKRKLAISNCSTFSADYSTEINNTFDSLHNLLSKSAHPSGIGSVISLLSLLGENEMPTKKLIKNHFSKLTIESTFSVFCVAVVSDIQFQLDRADPPEVPVASDFLRLGQSEIQSVAKEFLPFLGVTRS